MSPLKIIVFLAILGVVLYIAWNWIFPSVKNSDMYEPEDVLERQEQNLREKKRINRNREKELEKIEARVEQLKKEKEEDSEDSEE